MQNTIAAEPTSIAPTTFRLPRPGESDRYFGMSRAWYYAAEKRGWLKLIRIRDEGKERGITLVPFSAMAAFVKAQMEAQQGDAK